MSDTDALRPGPHRRCCTTPDQALDPLGDAEEGVVKNRAKVGSARPSSLLYTYGPGAIMDLPGFRSCPLGSTTGSRSGSVEFRSRPSSSLGCSTLFGCTSARRSMNCGPSLGSRRRAEVTEGDDLGIPHGCSRNGSAAPVATSSGRFPGSPTPTRIPSDPTSPSSRTRTAPAEVAAASRLAPRVRSARAPPSGSAPAHLHQRTPRRVPLHAVGSPGAKCPRPNLPDLKMRDANVGKTVGSTIIVRLLWATRGMAEAQGAVGRDKLPQNAAVGTLISTRSMPRMRCASHADHDGCVEPVVPVHPVDHRDAPHRRRGEGSAGRPLRIELGVEKAKQVRHQARVIRDLATARSTSPTSPTTSSSSGRRRPRTSGFRRGATGEARRLGPRRPARPGVAVPPEPSLFPQQQNSSGLMVTEMQRGPSCTNITRVVAVNQMKKVNAVLGFTRLDEMDRVNDLASRLVKLTRNGRPYVGAGHRRPRRGYLPPARPRRGRKLGSRPSSTSAVGGPPSWRIAATSSGASPRPPSSVDPDERLPAPRYWLLHTFAHTLIREMAMSCGYGAASLTERIYGWTAAPAAESRRWATDLHHRIRQRRNTWWPRGAVGT
jgi:hypothetical protein